MYELIIKNVTGAYSKIESDDLERLKTVAKRLNANGCSVEIIEKVVRFRIVQVNE